jgi:hypothetical protein
MFFFFFLVVLTIQTNEAIYLSKPDAENGKSDEDAPHHDPLVEVLCAVPAL